MISVGEEKTINVGAYKDSENDPNIRLFVSGLTELYDPMILTRGQPATMEDFRKRLENLLGVHIVFSPPTSR